MKQDGTYSILETGVVHRRDTGEPCGYTMRRLDLSYLPQMMQLQETIKSHLSDPHLMHSFSEDFMRLHLGEKGFSLGVIIHDELIAFRNTYFPDRDEPEWNLGPDLGLPARFFNSLVNLQFSCVHPVFRGNNLGYTMMHCALKSIKAMEKFSFCCATVSPYNIWSLDILLRNKFAVRCLKNKYEEKLRYIVCQNLSNPDELKMLDPVTVNLTDFKRQRELFAQGFAGVAINKIAAFKPSPQKELTKGYEMLLVHSPLF
jgi:hypothetical protein